MRMFVSPTPVLMLCLPFPAATDAWNELACETGSNWLGLAPAPS